jgi:hypothetical protein
VILRYALLADFANVTNDGKVNILGVADRIFSQQYPAVHRLMFLVMSLESEHDDDEQTRSIDIQLIDPDAQLVSRIQGQIEFGAGKQIVNQIHVFQDVLFNAPGAYQFNIFFDEAQVKAVELELLLMPAQPPYTMPPGV